MIPYFILLLIPSIFALFNTRKLSLLLWYITFVIFVLFVGLRFEVGPDWVQYGYIHMSLSHMDFWEVIAQAEPLSYLLFWVSQTSGSDTIISNIVAATIMMTGVFAFARRTANPWLAVVAATPYFIIVMGMSGVRQAMAAGIVLFLFSRWERYSFTKRGVYILIAALFHTSALVNNIFLITKLEIALRYKIALGLIIFGLTLYLSFEVSTYADNITRYQQRYLGLGGELEVESIGSLYHIAMIAIPATLGFIYRSRITSNVHSISLMYFGLYGSLSALAINLLSSTAASRLTVYLYFVPMMVYPALVSSPGKRPSLGSIFAVVVVHMIIMVAWFELANVSFTYVPYKTILSND